MPVTRARLYAAAKLAAAAVLVVAVGWHFARLLNNAGFRPPPVIRWDLLAAAGFLYLAAHTFWATFWWQLLWSHGIDLTWREGVRVYFVSQFGKYIPPKAWVIVIRMALLHRTPGASKPSIAALAFVETLTNMAAGALLAVMLIPWAGGPVGALAGNVPSEWAAVGILLLPLLPWTIGRLARRFRGPDARPLPVPSVRLLFAGLLQSAVGWCLLGLSLRCATSAVVPDLPALTVEGFVADVAIVSASYIAGFVVLVAPGGLGAREFVLAEMLAPRLVGVVPDPAATAVVIALLLRLVWTAFEAGLAGLWYLVGRGTPTDER